MKECEDERVLLQHTLTLLAATPPALLAWLAVLLWAVWCTPMISLPTKNLLAQLRLNAVKLVITFWLVLLSCKPSLVAVYARWKIRKALSRAGISADSIPLELLETWKSYASMLLVVFLFALTLIVALAVLRVKLQPSDKLMSYYLRREAYYSVCESLIFLSGFIASQFKGFWLSAYSKFRKLATADLVLLTVLAENDVRVEEHSSDVPAPRIVWCRGTYWYMRQEEKRGIITYMALKLPHYVVDALRTGERIVTNIRPLKVTDGLRDVRPAEACVRLSRPFSRNYEEIITESVACAVRRGSPVNVIRRKLTKFTQMLLKLSSRW